MISRYGVWDQLRIDGGKEFVLISFSQEMLQDFRNNRSRIPFLSTKSTDVCISERAFAKKFPGIYVFPTLEVIWALVVYETFAV